jgi:hypothetical protein
MMRRKCILILLSFLFLTQVLAQSDAIVKYKRKSPLKGLTLDLPSNFTIMTDDEMAERYPSYKKPLIMFISVDKKADFGINYSVNKWVNKNLDVLRDMYKSTLSMLFSEVEYIKEGEIVDIHGRKWILFEFYSTFREEKRIDESTLLTRKYNFLAYTLYKNKVIIANFNCSRADAPDYYKYARKIINSIKITDKLDLKDYEPYRTQGPQPIRIKDREDIQLDAIQKLNGSKPK